MKKLIIIIIIIFFACKKQEDMKQLNFYGETISVPSYLIADNSKVGTTVCKSNHYLKNKSETISVSIELCEYTFKERPKFDILNKYFHDGEKVMKEELLNLSWVNKKSDNKDNYYEFTYEFKVNDKFYQNTRFAYKNFYVGVKIEANDKNEIKYLAESIDKIKNINFSDDIANTKKENNCSSCKFPSDW
jgi:hypothetical protein